MKIGDFDVSMLRTGDIRLDGGAMFGVVPRVLWEKKMPSDDRNRIGMTMNALLVRRDGLNLLVDTGAGDKDDQDFRDMYGLKEPRLVEALAFYGLEPADIDIVVNTHLHFDHAGGNTRVESDGKVVPTFPNARYMVQRREFEDAVHTHERNKASYFEYNYKPLFDSGQMELLDGETEVAEGISAVPLPGHTLGLQGLLVESKGEAGLYLTDCVPTSHHIPPAWIMAYDLHPVVTLETKKRVLPEAAKKGWTLFFEHDPKIPSARIEQSASGKYRVFPLEEWDQESD